MELEDQELTDGINDIITLLEDEKELKSKECSKQAVLNLQNLLQENFIITTETEAEVCRAALASITLATNALRHIREEAMRDIELKKEEAKKYIDLKQEEAVKNVQETTESGSVKLQVELSELRQRVDKHDLDINFLQTRVKDIELDVAKLKQAQDHQTEHLQEIELRISFKKDIITYYREHESVIPVSPLVDEHNVPIEDLYVLPSMRAHTNSYFGPVNYGYYDGRNISISELFLSGNVRYKKIYIKANAGFGKTSLSQKLTMTWCQSHLPFASLTENYDDKGLAALKYFELLFLLHLRDYQSEPKCNLDDLIMQMISEKISRNTLYTKKFLQRMLHENKCLIILDGLDEWTHPGHCTRKPEVPHNNHPDTCTVLTTTRDWKMGTIGLSSKDIDQRVEISMLSDDTRKLLEKNAIRILNERNLNLTGKNIEDFDEELEKVHIGDIINIPYILLQLMCLFFNGLPIGNSKCRIYSNIAEFTLERSLNKINLSDIHAQSNDNTSVPNCMNDNDACKRYFPLLMKVGKLAFYTLFCGKNESSLIFDRKIVSQYMTEQEIEFCLKVGRLCQTKDNGIIAVKRYQVFFQHKSIQEFFSAIYITSEWQNESVKLTIHKVCSSLSGILEMSNVFVFVCGINPEVYTCISDELQNISDVVGVTRQYRTDMHIRYDVNKTIESYQTLQCQCLQESVRNGNDSCSIHLHDILIREYTLTEETSTNLKTLVNFSKGQVKSLLLSNPDIKIKALMLSLDSDVFTSLATLRLEKCFRVPKWLPDILTESAPTLKCLTLSGIIQGSYRTDFDISITALTGLTGLQSLYLANLIMTHSDIQYFYAYISQATTLKQLKLDYVHCRKHSSWDCDCDVILDIRRLDKPNVSVQYRPFNFTL